MTVLPGQPYPLGARFDGNGVNFAVFSELAERVELCLFGEDDVETRINMPDSTAHIWYVYLSGVGPGQRYGYRIYGPWDPKKGHRCCPTKLPLDPYGKAVEGAIQWSDTLFPYRPGAPDGPCSNADDAALTHKSVVINPCFDWRKEHRPNIPVEDTIIYEVHVKGFTKRHPEVPTDLRGTYAGLGHPVINQVKLIAEPWDVGEGGYQAGKFPPLWSEWNGIYRDTIRDYWRAQGTTLGQLASRFTGSSDLYENTGRRPHASVNFITAHDGFTLRDLVSYNEKHNEANLEDNKDGADDNRSWNCGIEGETGDPAINDLRGRQQRNFLTTLLLSQGMPMLRGGDLGYVDHRGEPMLDDDFLILFNAHWEDVLFKPALTENERPRQIMINTSTRLEDGEPGDIEPAETNVKVEGRSMVVLSRPRK